MHCASCVVGIEAALKAVAGVKTISINFATKQAEIEGEVKSEKLIDAMKQQGYEANVIEEEKEESQIQFRELLKSTIGCARRISFDGK